MIAPRNELARRIDTASEVVETGRPIEVVLHVVFTRPQELDRHARLFGDRRRLHHVVVAQATTKPATTARDVDRDVRLGNIQSAGDESATALRLLRRRPDFEFSILEARRSILRLER